MKKELLEHWIEVLKPLFPLQAYMRGYEKETIAVVIDWRLNTNKARSYKRSRLIKIIIETEVIKNYVQLASEKRSIVDEKIKNYIAKQMQSFDPEHDTPRGSVPPQVEWIIGKEFKE